MTWRWRYLDAAGAEVDPSRVEPGAPTFPTQGDAESWVGETWRQLAESGVAQVTLLDGDRVVYGPMSLSPAD